MSVESVILTLPSALPPVPPLMIASPEAFEPVPLPPLITISPASDELEAPPETVRDESSSPMIKDEPPDASLINTLPPEP